MTPRIVVDVRYAVYLLVLYEIGYALDELCLVDLIRQFRNDNAPLVAAFLKMSFGSDLYPA